VSPDTDNHLLSGAVGKRKLNFSKVLNESNNETVPSAKPVTTSCKDTKRKNPFSRFFGGKKQAKNKVGLSPNDKEVGDHYVKV
jgi:hypothetical protein